MNIMTHHPERECDECREPFRPERRESVSGEPLDASTTCSPCARRQLEEHLEEHRRLEDTYVALFGPVPTLEQMTERMTARAEAQRRLLG